jgi:NADH dehydrogenase
MMPGAGRRARLLVDWNIGLLFGRDTAELGRLGSPPNLGAPAANRSASASAVGNGAPADADAGAPADAGPTGR